MRELHRGARLQKKEGALFQSRLAKAIKHYLIAPYPWCLSLRIFLEIDTSTRTCRAKLKLYQVLPGNKNNWLVPTQAWPVSPALNKNESVCQI